MSDMLKVLIAWKILWVETSRRNFSVLRRILIKNSLDFCWYSNNYLPCKLLIRCCSRGGPIKSLRVNIFWQSCVIKHKRSNSSTFLYCLMHGPCAFIKIKRTEETFTNENKNVKLLFSRVKRVKKQARSVLSLE